MSVPFRLFSKRIHHSHIKYHLRFLCISRHFRIKRTIRYPVRSEKRGQKPRKGYNIVPFIRCPYTQRNQYIAPNPLSAHKRRKERDNNMSLLLCLRIRKGQYIIPLMHCLSARKGQYYVPLIFTAFPRVFHKRDNILPL